MILTRKNCKPYNERVELEIDLHRNPPVTPFTFFGSEGGEMSKHDRTMSMYFKFLSATATLRYEDKETAKLTNLYSEVRGQGHATQLLTTITDLADQDGISIWLEVQSNGDPHTVMTNSQLISFYEKFGFDVLDRSHCPVRMVRYPLLKGE